MVPRRSRAQSLYTSRTSSMADPAGSVMYCGPGLRRAGPKRSSNEPSGATSISRSSNAVRLSGTSAGE